MSRVVLPLDLDGVWRAMAESPGAHVMSGGTDLLVRSRRAGRPFPDIICLERVAGLDAMTANGRMTRVGATARLADIARRALIRRRAPLLAQAALSVGSPQIRAMATLGGNIATASPAADTLPALYCLGAEIELLSPGRMFRLPIEDFVIGPGRTRLEPGQIIGAVRFPKVSGRVLAHHEKVGLRQALAIAVVSLAALIGLGEDGTIDWVRLAYGSVGPTVMRARRAEDYLTGRRLEPAALEKAARLVGRDIAPITDLRASADYRRLVADRLLSRLAGLGAVGTTEKGLSGSHPESPFSEIVV